MDSRRQGLTNFYQKAIFSPLEGCCSVSEEAAKQIDREDLALRVAEAPQLAQGLASDAKLIGLVLPVPIPDSSIDALDPTLSTDPGSSLAQELSWQSAMAELLALVRLEGMAAAEAPAAAAASANALELLLASSPTELAFSEQPEPQTPARALKPPTPGFVETGFGEVDDSMLSLQDKDLFGPQSAQETAGYRTAGFGVESGQGLDIDLFGPTPGLISVSKVDNPISDPGTNVPIGEPGIGSGAAGISNGGTEPLENSANGLVVLAKDGAAVMKLDLNHALMNADEANNLTIKGDGDDKLMLVGDWVLVSEDPAKSVSVYAYADSPVSVVADNVEVVLA